MKLNLKSGTHNLAVNLISPESASKEPLPALIFIHGWMSNQQGNVKRATEISKLGFICLTVDLRGHGESGGTFDQFSREDHLEDIKVAYKYLTELEEVDKERIGIIGSSYGGYLAAVATNYLKFNWLVLRVPALYFDQKFDVPTDKLIKEDDKSAFRTSGLTEKTSLAIKGTANFKGKILIIESEKDSVIPHKVIENYLEIAKDKQLTYVVMRDAEHSLETTMQEKEYIDILKSFLN